MLGAICMLYPSNIFNTILLRHLYTITVLIISTSLAQSVLEFYNGNWKKTHICDSQNSVNNRCTCSFWIYLC